MRVIPVIDVLNNVVVHAVEGNRKEYQPLNSILTNSVNPIEVAAAFKQQGFSSLYLADLDAILGDKPNFSLYRALAQMGFNFMVDAGITDIETAKNLCSCKVSKIIIGTETLTNTNFVKEAIQQIGSKHIIVSLDIKDGKILTQPNFDDSSDTFELLKQFCSMGVSEFIFLDLSRVGSNKGISMDLLKQVLTIINNSAGHGRVYVGGGVQGLEDLLTLKRLDVLGVLLATTLHSGKINATALKQAELF